MAAVDSLLKIIGSRNAEGMTIASGKVPVLRKAGDTLPMSMPPLDAELVRLFVDELLAPSVRETLEEAGAAETRYEAEGALRYGVIVKKRGDGFQIVVRPGDPAGPSPAAAPTAPVGPVRVTTQVRPEAAPSPVAPSPVAPATAPDISGSLATALLRVEVEGASDLIVSTGQLARMRVDGGLVEIRGCFVDAAQLLAVVEPLMSDADRAALEDVGSCDFSLDRRDVGGCRYRVNVFRQFDGLAAAFRPIRDQVPTLDELELPSDLHRLAEYPHGLVLMAGPTGSGKSTTLVALIERVNQTQTKHIITLEDPIEYRYRSQHSLIHQRELGRHVESFGAGLRASLRESPDIILVGEMRDRQTIAAALTAAETGHLVLSTIHTPNGPQAVDRIIDVFPDNQQRQVRTQLAGVLRAVVSQHLIPRVGGGRVPAHETMIVNHAIAAMIREDKCHLISSQIQTGKADGMVPLERSVQRLVKTKRITESAARRVIRDFAGPG